MENETVYCPVYHMTIPVPDGNGGLSNGIFRALAYEPEGNLPIRGEVKCYPTEEEAWGYIQQTLDNAPELVGTGQFEVVPMLKATVPFIAETVGSMYAIGAQQALEWAEQHFGGGHGHDDGGYDPNGYL